MRWTLLVAALASVAGCAVGAPPYFSEGKHWTVPLVGPVEDGLLVVPVTVDGRGPYLFAIDPDSKKTAIDTDLAHEIHPVRGGIGPHIDDESDTQRPTIVVETQKIQIGDLQVDHRVVLVRDNHVFDTAGRRIRGILGRDVIADSLVFGFDRDAGIAYLTTQEAFHPPANAASVPFGLLTSHLATQVPPTGRKLVTADIDGAKLKLHVDLGGPVSQLRTSLWPKAHLTPLPLQTKLVDEVGTTRLEKQGAVAAKVTLGTVSRSAVFFVPYGDKRWYDYDLDGTLGLDFFRPFNVAVNWDAQKVYMTERAGAAATVAQRAARWHEPILSQCPDAGCAKVTLESPPANTEVPPGAGASNAPGMSPTSAAPPPATGGLFTVTRDPQAARLDLDITVQLIAGDGSSLPLLGVSLPVGTDTLSLHLPPELGATRAQVVDVSPFPRACKSGGGCVQELQTPR
jgi:hypothetical protein